MRIPHSPTIRIAAGLFLAALLSTVGYQVFRRRSSQAPEALLKRADDPGLDLSSMETLLLEERRGFPHDGSAIRGPRISSKLRFGAKSSRYFSFV